MRVNMDLQAHAVMETHKSEKRILSELALTRGLYSDCVLQDSAPSGPGEDNPRKGGGGASSDENSDVWGGFEEGKSVYGDVPCSATEKRCRMAGHGVKTWKLKIIIPLAPDEPGESQSIRKQRPSGFRGK